MKDLQTVIYEVTEGVATVTMNRAEAFNALNDELTFELQDCFREVASDDSVRAVILTGAGRAFSSGQDLKAVRDFAGDPAQFVRDSLTRRYSPLILAMRALPKPVIGAINGVAAGAGMSIALATDLRIASDKASFMQAFSRVGLVPDAGSNYLLPHLVGLPRALEMAWTARKVGAEEALQVGLVNRVVPAENLAAEARALAESLARGPALSIALTKKAMLRATEARLEEILALEADFQAQCIVTKDYLEGVAAFVEKREPRFGSAPAPSPA